MSHRAPPLSVLARHWKGWCLELQGFKGLESNGARREPTLNSKHSYSPEDYAAVGYGPTPNGAFRLARQRSHGRLS